jgi:DNA-directed RNA polymerase subunit H (RpoH/RPB5)
MAEALQHSMVPMHEVLPHDEALSELQPWDIVSVEDFTKLPLIAIDDPALVSAVSQTEKGATPTWPAGHVVRITRRSAYAGISTAYRLVVGTSAYGRTSAADVELVMFEDYFEEQEDEAPQESDLPDIITEKELVPLTDEDVERLNREIRQTEEQEYADDMEGFE